jgi:membrane associated rhomboid family serine protease
MASGPDLFVVCKSCGSEVSPYVTECPYCGTRLRKRAPKLDRGGTPKPPRPRRQRPRLAPLRRGEIPGIRPDRRPWVTILLVLIPAVVTIAGKTGLDLVPEHMVLGMQPGASDAVDGEWWRLVTTQLVYGTTGYEVAALAGVAIFGGLLERRHGHWAPLVVFLLGGTVGMLAQYTVYPDDVAVGGNAGALALLAAWAMRPVLERRRGRDDDTDLLGVLAAAILLVLTPLVVDGASALAGLSGGVAGIVLGVGLTRLRRR